MERLDVRVEICEVPDAVLYVFHAETAVGLEWLQGNAAVQEWRGSVVAVDLDRCAELCADLHLDGLVAGERAEP